MGLTNEKERFFDRRLNVRQVQDCPIYAAIEQLDQSIGTVLNKLDEHGWITVP